MERKQEVSDNKDQSFYGMNEYFRQYIKTSEISGKKAIVSGPTPKTQVDEPLILFVYSGSGRIIINHFHFKLSRGAFLHLSPFHNYTIIPDPDSAIELYSCSMSNGLYLYIMACPYVKMKELYIPQGPAMAQISNADGERAKNLFDSIIQRRKGDYYESKVSFLYVIELLGMLIYKLQPVNPDA